MVLTLTIYITSILTLQGKEESVASCLETAIDDMLVTGPKQFQ